jgi:hypothetical protein
MKQSKTAPWHSKSSLTTKFRKRNLERFKVIKAINERRDRRDQRQQQYQQEHDDAYVDWDCKVA